MSRFHRRLALTLSLSLIVIGMTSADDQINDVSQEDAAAVPKFDFAAAAAEYEIVSGSDRLICEPFQAELLKWSNPVRSTPAGTVFLWHHKGVPQAACCMFAIRNPDVKGDDFVNHEFVSLSTGLIEAKSDGAKKQFAITEAGAAELVAKAETVTTLLNRMSAMGEQRAKTDGAPIRRAMGNLRAVLQNRLVGDDVTAETLHDVAAILDEAAQKIERL